MVLPVTTIDARYSDDGSEATTWEVTRATLERAELFWITTVRDDGRPHVTPLVAVWVEDVLYFTTGEGEQKELNLRDNDHVILTTGRNSWEQGLDVVVEGDARVTTEEADLERAAAALSTKWDGRWAYAVHEGALRHPAGFNVLTFRVTPTKVLAFAKGPFSHTVHRFAGA